MINMVNNKDRNVSLKHYIDERIKSVEKQIESLNLTLDKQVAETKLSAKEAVRTSEKASEKALAAIDRRLEGVNEFRAQMADQQRTYVPRSELTLVFQQTKERMDKVEDAIIKISGQKSGYAQGMGTVALIAGLIATLVVLISRVLGAC